MNTPEIGILGGGQLARMLLLAAHPLGLGVSVMTAHKTDPAAQVSGSTTLGSLEDRVDLRRFLHPLKLATFESEFVDAEKLRRSRPSGLKLFPKLEALEAIQDRLTQKQLLDQFGVTTSPWLPVSSIDELQRAAKTFPKGFVLKKRRFGYDGYGTFVFRQAQKFDAKVLHHGQGHDFIAEEFVPFRRELAISFVRSTKGGFVQLPLVESVQVDSRCFSVCGPIHHPRLQSLARKVRQMMETLDYVGILAVELFDTGQSLIVNELAPRVHNSAHYSQDALTCSQFEYHWRAGLGLDLPKVQLRTPGFAMVNLLGEGTKNVKLSYAPHGFLHWYGKRDNRPGRKLGHINTLDKTSAKALARALRWRKDFQL